MGRTDTPLPDGTRAAEEREARGVSEGCRIELRVTSARGGVVTVLDDLECEIGSTAPVRIDLGSTVSAMKQLALALPPPRPKKAWGGRRKNAGRRPAQPGRRLVPHVTRPRHARANPVHVTIRAKREVAFLRKQHVFARVRAGIRAAQRGSFCVVHFSVQGDHVHLLVEANDSAALRSGMQGLTTRLARAINKALRRRGKVWADRHHRRRAHETARGPERARVRAPESSQARRARRPRARLPRPRGREPRPVLVVRLLRRMDVALHPARHRARGSGGRSCAPGSSSAHVAPAKGVAEVRLRRPVRSAGGEASGKPLPTRSRRDMIRHSPCSPRPFVVVIDATAARRRRDLRPDEETPSPLSRPRIGDTASPCPGFPRSSVVRRSWLVRRRTARS